MSEGRRHWLPAALIAAALVTLIVAYAPAPTVVRAPLVLVFALLGPGAAVVPLIALRDPLGEFTLALGVSCAIDVIVALGLLYGHAWSPVAGLAILAGLTLAGAIAQTVTVERGR
jgi:uncharacterized membrane protein